MFLTMSIPFLTIFAIAAGYEYLAAVNPKH
jgi:hypothetical protein